MKEDDSKTKMKKCNDEAASILRELDSTQLSAVTGGLEISNNKNCKICGLVITI